jgi:hypothetical protein
MTLYPTVPGRRTATIARDAAVVVLVVLFAWLGMRVHDGVAELAGLGRGLQDAGGAVSSTARDAAAAVRGGFDAAAGAVEGTPVVGGPLAGALRDAGASTAAPLQREGAAQGRRLIAAGRDGEAQAYRTANLLGWLTFGLPTLLVLSRWGPPRLRQARALTAARQVLGSGSPEPGRAAELARRAAYGLPYTSLARHTADPFGDLQAGRYGPLLAALGEDAGLRIREPREAEGAGR